MGVGGFIRASFDAGVKGVDLNGRRGLAACGRVGLWQVAVLLCFVVLVFWQEYSGGGNEMLIERHQTDILLLGDRWGRFVRGPSCQTSQS